METRAARMDERTAERSVPFRSWGFAWFVGPRSPGFWHRPVRPVPSARACLLHGQGSMPTAGLPTTAGGSGRWIGDVVQSEESGVFFLVSGSPPSHLMGSIVGWEGWTCGL